MTVGVNTERVSFDELLKTFLSIERNTLLLSKCYGNLTNTDCRLHDKIPYRVKIIVSTFSNINEGVSVFSVGPFYVTFTDMKLKTDSESC